MLTRMCNSCWSPPCTCPTHPVYTPERKEEYVLSLFPLKDNWIKFVSYLPLPKRNPSDRTTPLGLVRQVSFAPMYSVLCPSSNASASRVDQIQLSLHWTWSHRCVGLCCSCNHWNEIDDLPLLRHVNKFTWGSRQLWAASLLHRDTARLSRRGTATGRASIWRWPQHWDRLDTRDSFQESRCKTPWGRSVGSRLFPDPKGVGSSAGYLQYHYRSFPRYFFQEENTCLINAARCNAINGPVNVF